MLRLALSSLALCVTFSAPKALAADFSLPNLTAPITQAVGMAQQQALPPELKKILDRCEKKDAECRGLEAMRAALAAKANETLKKYIQLGVFLGRLLLADLPGSGGLFKDEPYASLYGAYLVVALGKIEKGDKRTVNEIIEELVRPQLAELEKDPKVVEYIGLSKLCSDCSQESLQCSIDLLTKMQELGLLKPQPQRRGQILDSVSPAIGSPGVSQLPK